MTENFRHVSFSTGLFHSVFARLDHASLTLLFPAEFLILMAVIGRVPPWREGEGAIRNGRDLKGASVETRLMSHEPCIKGEFEFKMTCSLRGRFLFLSMLTTKSGSSLRRTSLTSYSDPNVLQRWFARFCSTLIPFRSFCFLSHCHFLRSLFLVRPPFESKL